MNQISACLLAIFTIFAGVTSPAALRDARCRILSAEEQLLLTGGNDQGWCNASPRLCLAIDPNIPDPGCPNVMPGDFLCVNGNVGDICARGSRYYYPEGCNLSWGNEYCSGSDVNVLCEKGYNCRCANDNGVLKCNSLVITGVICKLIMTDPLTCSFQECPAGGEL